METKKTRNMKLKLGDWVVPRDYPFHNPYIKITIIEMRKYVDPNTSTNFVIDQVRVRYYDKFTPNGRDMSGWENAYEYELDIQRMRDEKLKEIGI
jgi:hypothetical protein